MKCTKITVCECLKKEENRNENANNFGNADKTGRDFILQMSVVLIQLMSLTLAQLLKDKSIVQNNLN